MIKKILSVIILLTLTVKAQDINKIFNEFIQSRSIQDNPVGQIEDKGKCSFASLMYIKNNYDKLTTIQKKELSNILDWPDEMQKSIVSSNGKFRIHFDTTGVNKPDYDINLLAEYCNEVYNKEIIEMGFLPPHNDESRGGDSLYDIYLIKMSAGDWGATDWIDGDDNKKVAYIRLNSTMSDKRVSTLDAVKITIAHEFHHMIQVTRYSDKANDNNIFYFEVTSTSMEEYCYDEVNDYYFELPKYFNRFNIRITDKYNSGYDRTILNLFLTERFGNGIIKRIWELIADGFNAIEAVAKAVEENGSTFKDEFKLFSQWCFATGTSSRPDYGFEEASEYPEISSFKSFVINENNFSVDDYFISTQPASGMLLSFIDSSKVDVPGIDILITNTDYESAVNYTSDKNTDLNYSFFNYANNGADFIYANYYSKLSSANLNSLSVTSYFEKVIPDAIVKTSDPFPVPFSYSKNSYIWFPVNENELNIAELYVYSVSMDLLYNGEKLIIPKNGLKTLAWNCKDNSGNNLGTGIYIFVIKSGAQIHKGKFAVYND